jgi:exonuclease V
LLIVICKVLILMNPIDTPTHDLMTGRESAPDLKARRAIDNGTMAAPTAQPTKTASEYDTDAEIRSVTALSDYGSDIGLEDIDEVTILANVLNAIKEVKPAERSRILPSIEFEEGEREDEDQNEDGFVHIHRPTVLRVAQGKRRTTKQVDALRYIQFSPPRESGALEVEYDQISRQSWNGTLTWSLAKCTPNTLKLTTNSV